VNLAAKQFDRLAVSDAEPLYRGILRRDARLDGRVWIAVRTTRIYCLPSCRSRRPNRRNVRLYFSSAAAERDGYRPCRKCRPEIRGGRRGLERAALRCWIDELATSDARIKQLIPRSGSNGVSSSRLYRMFRSHLGHGPRRARGEARLSRACNLLRDTRRNITEVAYEAGFGSVASFYRWFRRVLGTTPTRFRGSALLTTSRATWRQP
jgi:methylphosphotriester-DNA--protein-cysteine methyltransferase